MDILEHNLQGSNTITAYSQHNITVNQSTQLEQTTLLSPKSIIPLKAPANTLLDLIEHHWETLLSTQPEVVLFGQNNLTATPTALYRAFSRQNIGFEVMNLAAACRTYNILVIENRRVTAALLL